MQALRCKQYNRLRAKRECGVNGEVNPPALGFHGGLTDECTEPQCWWSMAATHGEAIWDWASAINQLSAQGEKDPFYILKTDI